ncbi:MAG: hypothetical protein WAM89_02965 [Terriglobales bacterium]
MGEEESFHDGLENSTAKTWNHIRRLRSIPRQDFNEIPAGSALRQMTPVMAGMEGICEVLRIG